MLKGALHFHSTYSDGEFTIAELRQIFARAGCSFALITDHADAFDQAKVDEYVAECAAQSDDTFLFVPGLEFSCEKKMHILGYGVTALAGATGAQNIISHIRRNGGQSVIAHPRDDALEWIESLNSLPDGIEAWNTKYDGQYAPRREVFDLIHRLQSRRSELHAFYGLDLHWKKQYRGMFNVLSIDVLSRKAILAALASGNYYGLKDGLELPADGRLSEERLKEFQRVNARSSAMRAVAKVANATLKRVHIKVPASVKAHLRRVF